MHDKETENEPIPEFVTNQEENENTELPEAFEMLLKKAVQPFEEDFQK